jgi:osmotically-inducible protein OsmY
MDMFSWPNPGDERWRGARDTDPVGDDDPDTGLALVVADRLRGERRLQHARIVVDVQDQVVILTGRVPSAALQETASDIVWRTPGVRDVCNRMTARQC